MLNADLIHGAAAAAAYCGLTRRTIYHMVDRGELPVIRKGRIMFFRKSELDRAFSSQAAAS
ncbi:helix-turn-helix domain-containing protein [Novosphingobium sp. 9U]|uniref:helix-turn-helix domain-containing protein n=1 Tax=Novosphingobium sp. 9U TaxID=2653158 RepID=UPI0012F43F85|nr:helix-turn-helix domain-containing protein [Novosphingobium sp. 9U]VWX52976.1 Helix-turn-helix domain-containing protein [Novosphingobium sp. 9U]